MHTFGHPVDLDGLVDVCARWGLVLVEDAAESLGSLYKGRHTGTFGALGTLSFNGNKIITTGGGGMVLAGEALGVRAKHLTTTAKQPHPYEYVHDEVGYNYRLPNLNAALGCAQLEKLEDFIASKRELASRYAAMREVMTRPIWRLMNHLPAYAHCLSGDLSNAEWLESRVVNLPSSVLPRTAL
jgi:dTDP-4-amino-4,6-dideoxygalactose transaminase